MRRMRRRMRRRMMTTRWRTTPTRSCWILTPPLHRRTATFLASAVVWSRYLGASYSGDLMENKRAAGHFCTVTLQKHWKGKTCMLFSYCSQYRISSRELLGCGSPDVVLDFCSWHSSLKLGKKAGRPLPLLHYCFAELKKKKKLQLSIRKAESTEATNHIRRY